MEKQTTYEGFAILELLGHRQLVGYIQEVPFCGTSMLRIDIPQGESTLTQFYGSSAIYCITPTTEDVVQQLAATAMSPVSQFSYRIDISNRRDRCDSMDDDPEDEDELPY